jgi:tRNA(fMet)-specific endonuclease VapC
LAFLIDTNVAIHIMDGESWALERMARHEGEVFISALAVAELQRGIHVSPEYSAIRGLRLSRLLLDLPVLAFDEGAAAAYGGIIAILGWVKTRDFDRMIAGHALSTRSVLITRNLADFRHVPGLEL